MDRSLRAFEELARAPESEVDLALVALHVAQIEHPGLIPQHHLKRLDELATQSGACGIPDTLHGLHRLREFLFEEEGFRGNSDDYYDPRNSCLNDVLDRKLGIPITLALLLMEVGWRVGLRIAGIGLPGHFVVSAHVGNDRVLLDPFDGGAVLTRERATDVVSRAVGRPVKLVEANFAPCSKRQIIARMLLNLKSVYAGRCDWGKAVDVMDRLLVVDPDSSAHVRDRGAILVKLGEFQRGAADWERYLSRNPEAPDADRVRQQLRQVRQGLSALN
jgi:regulator of sirC expression with transglutaminase-like and TPR domain